MPLTMPFSAATLPDLSLWSAFSLGVIHALEPGHGKALVATYAAATRPPWWQLLLLSGSLVLTHALSFGVLVGLLWWLNAPLKQYLPQLEQATHLLAALVVVGLGCFMLYKQYQSPSHCHGEKAAPLPACHQWHHHPNAEELAPTTPTENRKAPSFGTMVGLGLASGLRPCPVALTVILGALNMGEGQAPLVALGTAMGYVGLFSLAMGLVLGLVAAVSRGVGTLALERFKALQGPKAEAVIAKAVAWCVLALGLVFVANAVVFG